MLEVLHHTDRRVTCGCSNRVYSFATDHRGVHFCRMCADRVNGQTLCRLCQRPIEFRADMWLHTDQEVRHWKYKHLAAPETGGV